MHVLAVNIMGLLQRPKHFHSKQLKKNVVGVFSEMCDTKFVWVEVRERGTKQEGPEEPKQNFKFILLQRGRRNRSGFAVAGLHKCVQGESLDISK